MRWPPAPPTRLQAGPVESGSRPMRAPEHQASSRLGALALVLHAHLPFVRHPRHEDFLEERWFFEAVIECHLPMLRVLEGWERDGIPGSWALSVSPTLASMLADPLLQSRVGRHLERLARLASDEAQRQSLRPEWQRAAAFHVRRLALASRTWDEIGGDVLGAWRRWADAGRVELMTCAATHALLPLAAETPLALQAQVQVAIQEHRRFFGCSPRGFWLPECAYSPAVEPALRAFGIEWTVLETHGLLGATPTPSRGILGPIRTPAGLACFGRDPGSARQVWSRDVGYPGDPRYREFHRDIADDAEWDDLAPHAAGTEARVPTGIKLHRVTGPGPDKEPYDPDAAAIAVHEHARHFVHERLRWLDGRIDQSRVPPVIIAPYDAELFGHWWMEGPDFIDAACRESARRGLTWTSPGAHLDRFPDVPVARPAASSWGEGGHLAVWLDECNAWMQRPLRRMTLRLARWLDSLQGNPMPPQLRCLRQATREWMLAQASDWPFLVRMGTARAYAEARFRSHVERFDRLDAMAAGEAPMDEPWLHEVEVQDNLFPEITPETWRPRGP